MKTPNAELAAVDIRKLRDYCLNPIHDEGKHKARLFASVLGMTSDDAKDLQNILSKSLKLMMINWEGVMNMGKDI
jgi:hypothetical protein